MGQDFVGDVDITGRYYIVQGKLIKSIQTILEKYPTKEEYQWCMLDDGVTRGSHGHGSVSWVPMNKRVGLTRGSHE